MRILLLFIIIILAASCGESYTKFRAKKLRTSVISIISVPQGHIEGDTVFISRGHTQGMYVLLKKVHQ